MMKLDEQARARIIGYYPEQQKLSYYTSSGSEHDGAADIDGDSLSLSDLVDCFLEESCQEKNEDGECSATSDDTESTRRLNSVTVDLSDDDSFQELHRVFIADRGDQYRDLLVSGVQHALEMLQFQFRGLGSCRQQVVLRGVMSRLRSLGHNAAVCKTKWDASTSGGLVSGGHEFIDVLVDSSEEDSTGQQLRYFIDLDFAAKFEIARPTEAYKRLLNFLPGGTFVGKEAQLRKVVKLMSDAAKRSLKSRGLHLPPWRKNRYMQMKWFGPYRRTVNALPGVGCGGDGKWRVECRAVMGFDPVCHGVSGGYFVRT
uniref:Uncharacterized protein n=1 Tax=Kalanchoe fedtschenkoi TaxID=63787 RepID=A0A7N0UGU8_KALFE